MTKGAFDADTQALGKLRGKGVQESENFSRLPSYITNEKSGVTRLLNKKAVRIVDFSSAIFLVINILIIPVMGGSSFHGYFLSSSCECRY